MSHISKILNERPKDFDGFWASVSKVKTYDSCPAKYKFSYIEKLPRKSWDFHVYGKFLHKVLEDYHLERLNGSVLSDNVLMQNCFKAGIEEYKSELTKTQIEDGHKICVQYLQLLADQSEDGTQPEILSVEEDFFIDIDGKVLLRGFIDRVQMDPDGVLHVADYKTSKSSRYLKKDSFQLLTYAYVKCLQDPSIKKIRTSYIMLKLNFEYVTFEFTRAKVMKIGERFLKYAKTIQEEDIFSPNTSPLCMYCDYTESCDAGQEFIEDYKEKKKQRVKRSARNWGAQSW